MSPIARRMTYAAVATLALGVVLAVGFVVYAIRTSLVAEENLQAFFHAHYATIDYVQENQGQWPKSWDDLQVQRPESDFDWVAEHVEFNFAADPREIITQTPDTFTAIDPKQPCYVIDPEVEYLIKTLRKYHQPDLSRQSGAPISLPQSETENTP